MAQRSKPDPKGGVDQVLRALEAELAKATEHFRIAKSAAKQAKAEAKTAKKGMKQARTALAAAQEEREKALLISSKEKAGTSRKRAKVTSKAAPRKVHSRIAETPEDARMPRRGKKRHAPSGPLSVQANTDGLTVESATNLASDPNPDRDVPTSGTD